MAAENRLIANAGHWFTYNQSRNETAHTYDLKKAGEVYDVAVRFLVDAEALLKVLESKND